MIENDLENQIAELETMVGFYKQALTQAVSLPKGVMPDEPGRYFTTMINGNVVVTVLR